MKPQVDSSGLDSSSDNSAKPPLPPAAAKNAPPAMNSDEQVTEAVSHVVQGMNRAYRENPHLQVPY